ncbi:hypothetical protein AVEN_114736-1 [Araneus ventricosus]|uniref:Uncharacterized protein n=1 Tax=Araneus ventricosus TaxID=182803 RepID=A0A4Y2SS33_ARAVE|nr:hypothetical protein AVEN_114736-1 [Araneus ventricosus]
MLNSYTLQNSPAKSLQPVTIDVQPNQCRFSLDNTVALPLQGILSSSLSSTPVVPFPLQSFEELLSMCIRRVAKITCSEIRRKIETNAAVFTSNEFLKLVEKRDEEMKRKRYH